MDKEHEYKTLRDEANTTKKFVFERTFIIAAVTIAVLNFHTLYTLMIPISLLTLFINYWFIIYRIRSHARIVGYTKVFLENEIEYYGWETYLEYYRTMDPVKRHQLTHGIKKVKNQFFFWITFYHAALMVLITGYSILDSLNTSRGSLQIKSDHLNLTPEQYAGVLNILFNLTNEIKILVVLINLFLCLLMFVYILRIYIFEKVSLCSLYEIKIAEWIRDEKPRALLKKRRYS